MKDTAPDFPPIANVPTDPAPMTGFIANAVHEVDFSGDERLVMDCFQRDQLPVLSTLAEQFALLNGIPLSRVRPGRIASSSMLQPRVD
jgi:hypothetical protein